MPRLQDKVVFITGTAGGQGRAAALLFAQEGAHVIGCDIKEDEANETAEMVRTAGGRMDSVCPVDLSNEGTARDWIEGGVAKAGRIDILYNNASAPQFAFINAMTSSIWSYTLRNELDLVFNTVIAAWPHFERQGRGVIINTASVAGHRGHGVFGNAAHCAAKGGVIAFTKQLAAEGAPVGIRANSISPGGVIAPGVAVLPPDQRAELDRMHPIGRAGRPEDIAYCALYLASDEASWVTGSDFVVDGGLHSLISH